MRLGTALGARPETLMGRAGLSDLVANAFSPDSRFLIYATSQNEIASLELSSGDIDIIVPDSSFAYSSLEFSPCGEYLLAGSLSKWAYLWHWENGSEVASFDLAGSVTSARFSLERDSPLRV